MKKALLFKSAFVITLLAVLISLMSMPVFSDSGDDYELPFIPKETEHRWDSGVITTPATCTEPGVMTYTCVYNATHTYTEPIPAKGHRPSFPVIENEVAATYSTAGSYDEVTYCIRCHEELERTHFITDVLAPSHTPGDINGDSAVNNKDLSRLFQYLSDWDVEVNESALDVNGDGAVNNKDLTRLFQYLSDWEVEIF